MSGGPASRRQHLRFCDLEGWTEVLNARGEPVRHHITYELLLPSGNILRTRISRPANADAYGPALWATILSDQLRVTEREFWDCVDNRIPPVRETARPATPTNAIPASLAWHLVHTLGLTHEQVAILERDDAIALMNEHWSSGS